MVDGFVLTLIAGVFVGLSAGYVGSLMVLKKMALVGDALSHVALPGLALGIIFKFEPFIGAFAFLFGSAVVTWELERSTKLSVESIVGVLFTFALAVGILLTPEPDLLEALFGDITKIDLMYAAATVGISVVVIFLTMLIYKKIILGLISEELATSAGVSIARINLSYLLIVSLVIAVGIRIVGTLLVGVLVVTPAAAAKNVSANLSRYSLLSALFGALCSLSGVSLSGYLNLPVGPLVVLTGVIIFLAGVAAQRLLRL